MQRLVAKIMPFIVLGMMIVILIVGVLFLSYILVVGALFGLILFVAAKVKETFFPAKLPAKRTKAGRTFDHDEFI